MTESVDLVAALQASIRQVRDLRDAKREEPRPPKRPERGTVGDLSVGSVVLTTSHRFQTCRVCRGGIHVGSPVLAHWPVETSTIADYYHPSCVEGDAHV